MINQSLSNASFTFEDDRYCQIPDDKYVASFYFYQTKHMFNGIPKIEIWFEICDDEYQGFKIPKWYNCLDCKNPRKNGHFKVARRSNFSLDFIRLFNHEIKRRDRAPMSYFNNYYFLIETETVTKNFEQRNYPEQLQYSKVKEIVKATPL